MHAHARSAHLGPSRSAEMYPPSSQVAFTGGGPKVHLAPVFRTPPRVFNAHLYVGSYLHKRWVDGNSI